MFILHQNKSFVRKQIVVLVFLWITLASNIGLLASPVCLYSISNLDPTIINGKQYSFTLPNVVVGHQFYNTDEFLPGSLTIKGQKYENQLLRYDILNQLLTLSFTDQFGSKKILIVSDAWLSNFTIGRQNFELVPIKDSEKKIFQLLGKGDVKVRYYWKKQLKLEPTSGKRQYKFSKQIKESYLLISGKTIHYSGNRSFARCFGEENSKAILSFLKQHKIKVKKASDTSMEELLEFCNSIITK